MEEINQMDKGKLVKNNSTENGDGTATVYFQNK